MKQDKLIKEHFKNNRKPDMSHQLEARIMNDVFKKANIRKKRSYWLGIALTISVSLCMVAGGIYLLKEYVIGNWSEFISSFLPSESNESIFQFYIFIAFIAFFLLVVDVLLRKRNARHKHTD